MPDYEYVLSASDGPVGVVTLNRPRQLNALAGPLLAELVDALERHDADTAIRAIVVTGGPTVFAAGADIKEMADASVVDMLSRNNIGFFDRVRHISKPLIAAVAGYALGGGCELAMLCDIIIAAETARFGQPEINLGLIPGAGGTQRLPRAVGKYRAMELIMTGRQIPARQACEWGLVNRVVPAEVLLDEARALAREIAAKPPVAVRLAKEAILKSLDTPMDVGLDHERRLFYLLFRTEDMREGVDAVLCKRKATFKGR